MDADVVVIGGGMVGSAIAYGIASAGASVCVLDENDNAFRAARGNFGLTWVQSKGLGVHPYFRLSLDSVDAWQSFADELATRTAVDVAYRRPGGLILTLGEREAEERRDFVARFRAQAASDGYDCRFIERDEVQALFPAAALGPSVSGATYSPMDGHANPLRLLRALIAGVGAAGGRFQVGQRVREIRREGDLFAVDTGERVVRASKVVVAAGLGTAPLARMVGIEVPVRAQRGQLIATERTAELFTLPMSGLRQTAEGSVLIGYTNEDVGLNTDTTAAGMKRVTERAIASFPMLARLRLVRAWAALRVLTPDGRPVYAQSRTQPGAFAATCHSGVTLAAAHARLFPGWVLEGRFPPIFQSFGPERFDVQANA